MTSLDNSIFPCINIIWNLCTFEMKKGCATSVGNLFIIILGSQSQNRAGKQEKICKWDVSGRHLRSTSDTFLAAFASIDYRDSMDFTRKRFRAMIHNDFELNLIVGRVK